MNMSSLSNLDHVLLGCHNLEEGIAYLEKLSGYRAAFGGAHPDRGTHNALLKLGPHSYLEIVAPDPRQNELAWFPQLALLTEPLLIGYAAQHKNLDEFAKSLHEKGIASNGPFAGSRTRPDGQLLRWKTLAYQDEPWRPLTFIEWDVNSPHPSSDAPGALELYHSIAPAICWKSPLPPPGMHKILLPEHPSSSARVFTGLHGEFDLLSQSIPSETWAY